MLSVFVTQVRARLCAAESSFADKRRRSLGIHSASVLVSLSLSLVRVHQAAGEPGLIVLIFNRLKQLYTAILAHSYRLCGIHRFRYFA